MFPPRFKSIWALSRTWFACFREIWTSLIWSYYGLPKNTNSIQNSGSCRTLSARINASVNSLLTKKKLTHQFNSLYNLFKRLLNTKLQLNEHHLYKLASSSNKCMSMYVNVCTTYIYILSSHLLITFHWFMLTTIALFC